MTDKIADRLTTLLANAYAPHSGVRVASAVEDENGRLHLGVNVENSAYPEGMCAEASAISAAVTAGARRLRRVFLTSSLGETVWPCGGCRQKILEFAQDGCEVISFGPDGPETLTIEALAPRGFRLRGDKA